MKRNESQNRPSPRADPLDEMLMIGELIFKLLLASLVIALVVEFA